MQRGVPPGLKSNLRVAHDRSLLSRTFASLSGIRVVFHHCCSDALLCCLIASYAPQALAQSAAKIHRKVVVRVEPEYPVISEEWRTSKRGLARSDGPAKRNVSKVRDKGRQSDVGAVCLASGDEVEICSRPGTNRRRSRVQFQPDNDKFSFSPLSGRDEGIRDFCPRAASCI